MSTIENPILKNITIDPEFENAFNKVIKYATEHKNPFGEYPKLVRDNIPEIILTNNPAGTSIKYTKLGDEEYKKALIRKLHEEVIEYIDSDDVKELADILEVVYALGTTHGETKTTLDNIRRYKNFTNGKFNKRIYLEEVKIGSKYEDPKDKLEESED